MKLLPRILLQVLAGSVCTQLAVAAEKDFSVGIYLGAHRPALEDLNNQEFKSPIGGFATVLDSSGTNVQIPLNFQNPLPRLELGANVGLEFQWRINHDYSFILGGDTWQATSRAISAGGFYVQGAPADVINQRIASLSYNEFFFGVKRNIVELDNNIRLYYRLTLNEVFNIHYREDLVFLYTAGKAATVKKSIVLQSRATGLLMLQPGFGTEYLFRDWLSVGVEASYVVGLNRITLRDGTSDADFLPTDNLTFWLPQTVDPNSGNLQYLNHNFKQITDYSIIHLNFDGWKMLFKINIYF